MSLRELALAAQELGHGGIDVRRTPSGRRWFASCSCGWPGVNANGDPNSTRATETQAILSAMRHITGAVRAAEYRARLNGQSADGGQALRHA